MLNQFNDQLKKTTEQFQASVQNPQQVWTDLQAKNQVLAQQLQQVVSQLPAETANYVKDQQEKAQALNAQLVNIFSKQPVDMVAATRAVLEYTQQNVAFHVEKTKENSQKLQSLIQGYSVK